MKQRIDLHTHILPAVDDGSPDWETTAKMLRLAYADGTGALVLTPHFRHGYAGGIEQIRAVFAQVQALAAKKVPGLELFLGTEILCEVDLVERLAAGEVLTLAGTQYVLLEYRPSVDYSMIQHSIRDVMNYGYIPIMAHAERYDCLRRRKERSGELVDMGALLQVNADSILGRHGFGIRHFCAGLLRQELVSFVASDAHNASDRSPVLSGAERYVARKYGMDYARELFYENVFQLLYHQQG
ncbi:CpsB/CapC family capsule biosynthesis tyrosine phosphatase [Butyricicoccus sp.]|uniref:CpsB/CapC family capsule biosynthesis tyrosine phosphatase n=1 Tax=Butyricicoccus sp. TaxID=2049021 RepID=UPI003F14733C